MARSPRHWKEQILVKDIEADTAVQRVSEICECLVYDRRHNPGICTEVHVRDEHVLPTAWPNWLRRTISVRPCEQIHLSDTVANIVEAI